MKVVRVHFNNFDHLNNVSWELKFKIRGKAWSLMCM